MKDEILIKNDVVYVKGFQNGAIYNFNTGRLYNINHQACIELDDFISHNSNCATAFINKLVESNLIDKEFQFCEYIPEYNVDKPLNMAWLELTSKCNLKCVHCYEGNVHVSEDNPLELNDWFNIIDQLAEMKVDRIILIGGEPACFNYVEQVIEHIANYKHIQITFFSNCTLLNSKLIDCFAKHNVLVKVSIYGHNAEIHNKITQVPYSFELMTKNIKIMQNRGIKVFPSFIVMKENEQYIDDIIAFIKDMGMPYKKFDIIRKVYNGTQNFHAVTKDNVVEKYFYTKPKFFANKEFFDKSHFINTCWFGKIAIKEDGDCIPCVFERNTILGNAKKTKLTDILNASVNKKTSHLCMNKINECKLCEYKYACKDCRPLGISKNGDFYDKNVKCRYNPIKGTWDDELEDIDNKIINEKQFSFYEYLFSSELSNYFVPDLPIDGKENIKTLFIVESPHKTEIKSHIPLTGKAGKLLSSKLEINQPFGDYAINKGIGIMNISNVPLQPAKCGIDRAINIDAKLNSLRTSKKVDSNLLKVFCQRLKDYRNVQNIVCLGNFAKLYLDSITLNPTINVIYLPHPSSFMYKPTLDSKKIELIKEIIK